jgi:hypothetical protein
MASKKKAGKVETVNSENDQAKTDEDQPQKKTRKKRVRKVENLSLWAFHIQESDLHVRFDSKKDVSAWLRENSDGSIANSFDNEKTFTDKNGNRFVIMKGRRVFPVVVKTETETIV